MKVVGPLGAGLILQDPRDFQCKATLITKPQKSSSTQSEL